MLQLQTYKYRFWQWEFVGDFGKYFQRDEPDWLSSLAIYTFSVLSSWRVDMKPGAATANWELWGNMRKRPNYWGKKTKTGYFMRARTTYIPYKLRQIYQLGFLLFTAKQDLTGSTIAIDSSSEAPRNSATPFCGQCWAQLWTRWT